MANTWTLNSDGSVLLNGSAVPNVLSSELQYKRDNVLNITEVQLLVQVTDTVGEGILENIVSILPGDPSLSSIHVGVPSILLRSALGDTIDTQALSVSQSSIYRPEKEGV